MLSRVATLKAVIPYGRVAVQGSKKSVKVAGATTQLRKYTVPTSTTVEDKLTKGIPAEHVKLFQELHDLIEQNIWNWLEFPIELPQSSFSTEGKRSKIKFQQKGFNTSYNEVESLAYDENGNRNKLSAGQLEQLLREATLNVKSKMTPEIDHVWKMSPLLLTGREPIIATMRTYHSMALRQLTVEIPSRLFKGRLWSVPRGFVNMVHGVRDAVASLIGLREQVSRFSSYDIEQMVGEERKQFVLAGTTPRQPFNPKESSTPDILDFAAGAPPHDGVPSIDIRYRSSWHEKNFRDRLVQLLGEVHSRWAKDKHAVVAQLREQLHGKLEGNELEQEIVDQCATYKVRRLNEAVETCGAPNQLATYMVCYLRALLIVKDEDSLYNSAFDLESEATYAKLRKEHPTRAGIYEWLESAHAKHMKEWSASNDKRQDNIMKRLKEANLSEQLYLFQRDLQFAREQEPAREKELAAQKVPTRTFTWYWKIWNPKNWAIHERENVNGQKYYTAVTWIPTKTNTSVVGYRFWNMYQACIHSWGNGLWGLSWSLLWGPLSIRSLFKRSPYYAEKMLDSKTGEIIDNPHSVVLTFAARIGGIIAHIRQSRAKFENTPDRGILGKNLSRIFNVVWNWLFKGVIGVGTVVIGQPILTALNIVICSALVLLSVAWAPLAGVVRYLFSVLIFDLDHCNIGTPWFPLLYAILGKTVAGGVGNVLTALISALIVHPLIAVFLFSTSTARAGVRLFYDAFMFHMIVKRLARVPAGDTFLARRISGPNMAQEIFFSVELPVVLAVLQASLEKEELSRFELMTREMISRPLASITSNPVMNYMSSLPISFATGHLMFAGIRDKVQELRKELDKKLAERRKFYPSIESGDLVRLTEEQIADFKATAPGIVKKFLNERLFPMMSAKQVDEWWHETKGVPADSYEELAWMYIKQHFSSYIDTPLSHNDKFVKLNIPEYDSDSFKDMVVHARPTDPLEVAHIEVAPKDEPLQPKVPEITNNDILNPGMGADRLTGGIIPLTRDQTYLQVIRTSAEREDHVNSLSKYF